VESEIAHAFLKRAAKNEKYQTGLNPKDTNITNIISYPKHP